MADLDALRDFAADRAFGLTAPLTHDQVVILASNWQPEVYFYVDERFHPISMDERISMVEGPFAQLPDAEQEQWRVSKLIRTGPDVGRVRDFDPPVMHVPDGSVTRDDGGTDAAVRIINDGSPTREAFEDSAIDGDAVFTHGASAPRAREFFGARQTLAGESVGTSGDGLVPRARDITVMATYKNLLDLLKYELLVEEADDYPPDALRGGFEIAGLILEGGEDPLAAGARRQFLLELIAAYEAGDFSFELDLPPGWKLNRRAWEAVVNFAFLEYDFFYAYNDWERYQTAVWDNQHEGDDEGCCLVFDRRIINLASAIGDVETLKRVVPHSIITCVHEELQRADLFDFIHAPTPPAEEPDRLPRQDMTLAVFVAGGSHATYLTPGTHDVVDFQDFWSYSQDIGTVLLPLLGLPVLVVFAMIEHLQDTHDFTSDDGIRTGPAEFIGEDPGGIPTLLTVMPMSVENHIYQPQHADLLRLRAFSGKWGGHDGPINKSPAFSVKTGRYFRELLRNL